MRVMKKYIYKKPKLTCKKIEETILMKSSSFNMMSDLLSVCVPNECGAVCTSIGGTCDQGCCT